MRIPRVRFTVRTMMIAVVIVALALVLAVPAFQRVLWLYKHALTGSASILHRHAEHDEAARLNPARPTYRVGQPIPLEANYAFTPGPWIPGGLPYRVTVEVKMTDPTFRTVYETYCENHYALTDPRSMQGVSGTVRCSLTPRQPGRYAIRYEVSVTDLFGRTQRGAALATGAFNAR